MTDLIKLSNEVKIGLTVLIAVVVAFVGFKTMRDQPLFKTSTTVFTKFNNVSGLTRGNPVLVKGFKIGNVKEMSLEASDSTLVTLSIDEGVKIPKGSVLYLRSVGVLGGKFIELLRNSENSEMVEDNGFVVGIYDKGIMDEFAEKGSQLTDQVSSSIEGVETLVNKLNGTLSDQNQENIANTLEGFSELSNELNTLIDEKKEDVDAITESIKNILSTMDDLSAENKEELDSMIKNLESTSGKLDALSSELNKSTLTLNNILNKIDSGEGTLGKLVSDPSLYNNLDTLSVNLNQLIKDIQADPKKYLKHMRLVEVF